jgi:hypothetical protein
LFVLYCPFCEKKSADQVTDNYLTDNEARIRDIELLTGLQFFTGHKNHVLLRTFLPHGLWTKKKKKRRYEMMILQLPEYNNKNLVQVNDYINCRFLSIMFF